MIFGKLYVDGEPLDAAEIPEKEFRVQYETPAAEGYEWCGVCGDEIADYGDGYRHTDAGSNLDDDHTPTLAPLSWCNSATLTFSEEEDAVHVSISVGDPRGAFSMTVRRLTDGTIVLHHPYPGEGWAHMETREDHPGTLVIVGTEPRQPTSDQPSTTSD
jgi:hypothetical protein